VQARLIPGQNAVDLSKARFILGQGADAFQTTSSAFSGNWIGDFLEPRHKLLSTSWQWFTATTLYESQLRNTPPPPLSASGPGLPTATPPATNVVPTPTLTPALPEPTPTAAPATPAPTPTPQSSDGAGSSPKGPGAEEPGNLLANAGFEQGSLAWTFFTNGSGSFAVRNGRGGSRAARVLVTWPNSNTQLYQSQITLEPNTRYRLTFKARSEGRRDLAVFVHKNGPPFTAYGLHDLVVDLSREWETYSIEFVTTGFSDVVEDARLRF